MIRINLLGEAEPAAKEGVSGLFLYVGSVVVTLAILFGSTMYLRGSAAELESQVKEKEETLAKLRETTKEVKNLESLVQELVAKVAVINTLKKSKRGPVRVLDDVNTAFPQSAWLTDMTERAGIISISGMALDNQTVADLMRSLSNSLYIETVELEESKNIERLGVNIQSFLLKAKVAYAGKNTPKEEIIPLTVNEELPPKKALKPTASKDDI